MGARVILPVGEDEQSAAPGFGLGEQVFGGVEDGIVERGAEVALLGRANAGKVPPRLAFLVGAQPLFKLIGLVGKRRNQTQIVAKAEQKRLVPRLQRDLQKVAQMLAVLLEELFLAAAGVGYQPQG